MMEVFLLMCLLWLVSIPQAVSAVAILQWVRFLTMLEVSIPQAVSAVAILA